ncbi:MAG: hypothetical protein ACRDVE_06720 [Actinocrinis sp.]
MTGTGTVLYDGAPSTTGSRPEIRPGTPPRAVPDQPGVRPDITHFLHGLVAIANGPDYCLCGLTWPCAQRAEWDCA